MQRLRLDVLHPKSCQYELHLQKRFLERLYRLFYQESLRNTCERSEFEGKKRFEKGFRGMCEKFFRSKKLTVTMSLTLQSCTFSLSLNDFTHTSDDRGLEGAFFLMINGEDPRKCDEQPFWSATIPRFIVSNKLRV